MRAVVVKGIGASAALCVVAAAGASTPGFQPESSVRWPASLVEFLRGDADGDDAVNFLDVTAVLSSWSTDGARDTGGLPPAPVITGPHQFGDATGDGFIADNDLQAVIEAFGTAISAAETTASASIGANRTDEPSGLPRAIAAWDEVPYRAFQGKHSVGVVAFHIGGIERVEFRVNGVAAGWVPEMSENPSTGVNEYTLELDGAALPVGVVEVGAVAVPEWGEPRDLGTIRLLNRTGLGSAPGLYVRGLDEEESPLPEDPSDDTGRWDHAGGTGTIDDPFVRIYDAAREAVKAGTDTIYLLPGDHLWAGRKGGEVSISLPPDFGWLTVAAAPGFGPSEVRIVGNSSGTGGLNAQRVRLRDISVVRTSLDTNRSTVPSVWFDRCVLSGADRSDTNSQFASGTAWTGGIFATDTLVTDVRTATKHWDLVRGCRFERIGSDVFHNPATVIDCEVDDVRKEGGGAHPDLIQLNGDFDNVIVYGLKATNVWAQGIFSRGSSGIPDRNLAFVNIEIDAKNYLSQWLQSADHLLFWNVSFLGRALNISNDPGRDPTQLRFLSVRECAIHELRLDPKIRAEVTQVWLGNAIGAERGASAPEPVGLFSADEE